MRLLTTGSATLVCFFLLSVPGRAAPVTIESLMQADFAFTGTAAGAAAFRLPVDGVRLDVRAVGNMAFTLDDTGGSTAAFTAATGQLFGVSPPTAPDFLPFNITPVGFNGGSLINIARDIEGRIMSGTIENLAMPWEMIGTGDNEGVVLYGDQATTPLLFSGDVAVNYDSGVPTLAMGSVISGLEDFNVYLYDTGNRETRMPGSDPRVFIGSDRYLTAVPEPSALLLGVGAVGLLVARRRHLRRVTA